MSSSIAEALRVDAVKRSLVVKQPFDYNDR